MPWGTTPPFHAMPRNDSKGDNRSCSGGNAFQFVVCFFGLGVPHSTNVHPVKTHPTLMAPDNTPITASPQPPPTSINGCQCHSHTVPSVNWQDMWPQNCHIMSILGCQQPLMCIEELKVPQHTVSKYFQSSFSSFSGTNHFFTYF